MSRIIVLYDTRHVERNRRIRVAIVAVCLIVLGGALALGALLKLAGAL